jgi:hypothetical protein
MNQRLVRGNEHYGSAGGGDREPIPVSPWRGRSAMVTTTGVGRHRPAHGTAGEQDWIGAA